MGRYFSYLLLLCGVFLSGSATAGEAYSWLQKMSQAAQQLSYTGTLVYLRGDQLSTLKVIRRQQGQQLQERLYTLDGVQREIIKNGEETRCLLPKDESLVVESQLAQGFLPQLELQQWRLLESAYDIELLSTGRVAGVSSQMIGIHSKDHSRYDYELWLEQDTGLLLRMKMYDPQTREVLRQMSFTELNLGAAITDQALQRSHQLADYIVLPSKPASRRGNIEHQPHWQLMGLPNGFELTSAQMVAAKGVSGNKAQIEHLVYSDGLASISLYVEPAPKEKRGEMRSSLHGLSVFSRFESGYLLTLVGEVPAALLQKLGRQVSHVKQVTTEPSSSQ
jgi:sigma-E factor negative regulatory protein RseB